MNNKSGKKGKLLLLGWDAADWKVLNPMIDKGLMPNFKKLVEGGTISSLSTLDPPYSPMLWTSIATGKRPYKHGVLGFSEVSKDGKKVQPVMSTSRNCKAIWNIFNQENLKSHVVGWWPSHPAEPINGVMISNLFQNHKGLINEPWPIAKGTVHPEKDSEFFAQFRVHPQEMTGSHLLPFVSKATQIDQQKDKRLFAIAKVTAHASSLHAAFTNIIREREWDFAALYLDAIDHYCHGFMKYHPPKRDHIAQDEYDYYHNVVTAGYRFHDMMLGRIMDLINEDTTLMLISDHGFQPDHLRPRDIPKEPAGPAYEHSPYGILVVKGPRIKKDHIIYGTSVIDICPTLLALQGLPIGKDMDGRVLKGIFEKTPEITYINSWEEVTGHDGMLKPLSGEEGKEISDIALKQLEDLGYIEKQTGSLEERMKSTRNECQFNLARAYIDGGLIGEAIEVLEKLHSENMSVARFTFRLASCHQAIGNHTKTRSLIDLLKSQDHYEGYAVKMMEAALLLEERQPFKAIDLFKSAESNSSYHHPKVNLQIARCYIMLKRWNDAENYLKKELDPDTTQAYSYLGRIYLFRNHFEKAADAYLNAIGLDFNEHANHYGLGMALFKLGRYEEASKALENVLVLNCKNNLSRELLVNIYKNHFVNNDKYRYHKDFLMNQEKPTIYVVSGLPRSGTSLMMQMLEQGGLEIFTDRKREKDENNPKGYYEHEAVKSLARKKKWLSQAEDKAVKVITQLVPHLTMAYNYKIIYIERDITEVIASQSKMLNRLGKKYSKDVYPLQLVEKFKKQVSEVKSWMNSQNNVEVLFVQHKEAIENPFKVALEVANFLDVSLNPEKMARVVDSELHREKISTE